MAVLSLASNLATAGSSGSTTVNGKTAGSLLTLVNNPESAFKVDGNILSWSIPTGMSRLLGVQIQEVGDGFSQIATLSVSVTGNTVDGVLTDFDLSLSRAGLTQAPVTVTAASYTALNDNSKYYRMNSASGQTFTVPSGLTGIPVGGIITVVQLGAGATTIAAGAGVTISKKSTLVSSGQYSIIQILKDGTDSYIATGGLS